MGRKNNGALKMVIGLLVLVIVLAAAVFVFQPRTIDVYGNTRHSAEEIAEGLSGNMVTGSTLYLAWKYRKNQIPETMPYLDSVHVEMVSPSHIEIQVSERAPIAYIDKMGYVYFDNTGMVLGISEQAPASIPLVTGMQTEEVTLYQKIPVQSSAQLRTVLSLAQLLKDQDLYVSEIRFGENMEITVFADHVQAEMGQDEYLEEKVANLSKILPRLESQAGILHLENFTGRNETVSFSPNADAMISEDLSDVVDIEQNTDTEDPNGESAEDGTVPEDAEDTEGKEENKNVTIAMVFNSSGTLIYNVHIQNGLVVDSYGNEVPGCYVNENGNAVDAYMNVFDKETGELITN